MKFKVHHFEEVTSTNSLARDYAAQGAPEGTVLVAQYQSEGRGKPGRKWLSPAGKNLLFSLLLRPQIPVHRAPGLTQIACRSVASVLKDKYGVESRFKRPNDILVKGSKICGVLVESSSKGGQLENVIIGIGLNVNSPAEELIEGATSMLEVLGRKTNRHKILEEILKQLKKDLSPLGTVPTGDCPSVKMP
ncbi:MAG: biotin--[acetyl-CoA-carboxylase] ligase [Candidatus Omnitrophica bacterium]|nr:biotin--[acetyl-CoA-carboxylase] ligase [Candidatus Omnitrophota bacterium]